MHALATKQGARVVFYQTWGRRDGDKKNIKLAPDYTTMQDKLSASYTGVAEELKAEVAPVGEVWRVIHETDKALFKRLYKGDGSHPAGPGAYLAASTIYRQITGKMPVTDKLPKGVSEADAKTIRAAIDKVMGQ
jgi:hypothetical protein